MRTISTLLMTVALLTGSALGVAARDAGGPFSTDELLAGYVTEEVEPGVFRYQTGWGYPVDLRSLQLGAAGATQWGPGDVEVRGAPDGTVWTAGLRKVGEKGSKSKDRRRYQLIRSFDEGSWTTRKRTPDRGVTGPSLDVGRDGTVWAAWADPKRRREIIVARLGADGWEPLEPAVGQFTKWDDIDLSTTDDGDVWVIKRNSRSNTLYHHVDGAWQTTIAPRSVAVGRDGTAWGIEQGLVTAPILLRFGGEGWEEFPLPRGVDGSSLFRAGWSSEPLAVAPDGSVWLGLRGPMGPDGSAPPCGQGEGNDGVGRFDGRSWDRYLAGHGVERIQVAPDGAIWVWTANDPDSGRAFYVIRPEGVEPPAR